jgi:hypothetical protein
MRTGSVVGLSAVICLAFASNAAPTNPPSVRTAPAPAPIYRIIVRLRSDAPSAESTDVVGPRAAPGGTRRREADELNWRRAIEFTLRRARRILPGLHAVDRSAPRAAGQSLQATLARLRADPAVLYAEPDQQRHVLADAQ